MNLASFVKVVWQVDFFTQFPIWHFFFSFFTQMKYFVWCICDLVILTKIKLSFIVRCLITFYSVITVSMYLVNIESIHLLLHDNAAVGTQVLFRASYQLSRAESGKTWSNSHFQMKFAVDIAFSSFQYLGQRRSLHVYSFYKFVLSPSPSPPPQYIYFPNISPFLNTDSQFICQETFTTTIYTDPINNCLSLTNE